MFSTDFIFRQQENLVDNKKCQAEFRPLCNKILFSSKPERLLINLKSLHVLGTFFLENMNANCRVHLIFIPDLRRSTFKSNKKNTVTSIFCCTLHSWFLKINSLFQQFASFIHYVTAASSKDDQKRNAYLNRKLQIILPLWQVLAPTMLKSTWNL